MNSNILSSERKIRQVSSGDRVIHISYGSFLPGDYEKQVILGNRCSALVPVRCIFDGDSADIFYIVSGLCGFTEYVEKQTNGTRSFLELFLGILKEMQLCGQYLIPHNEISLLEEHLFFSEMNGEAKLLYMPGSAREEALGQALAGLVQRAERRCHLGLFQRELLDEYRNELLLCEEDLEQMIGVTEETMRKTYGMEIPEMTAAPAAGVQSVREQPKEYAASGGIRRHLKDLINDLVS